MKLSKREQLLITVAVLLIIVLGYRTLVTPYSLGVEEKTVQLESLINDQVLTQTKISSISDLEAYLLEAEDTLSKSRSYLGVYQEDETLDTVFSSIAQRYGMDVLKLSISDNVSTFQTVEDTEDVQPFTAKNVDISMTCKQAGTALDLTSFINMVIEISARPDTVVDSMSYSVSTDASNTAYKNLDFVISTVVFMEYQED
ncbi:hypothetical protein RFF05_16280 [Bengtsoniella intestinalis]|uniref:hypothetical protein n=1 Tax=Bengtsoniella intestinalis TaxID=3073143 RepID=UPI00391F490B